MTEHILLAVDLTHPEDATALLHEADKLAGFYGATLSVVTVLPDYGSSWVGTFFKQGTLKKAAESASETLHKLVKEAIPDRQQVQHIVEVGTIYEQVLVAVEESKADLVIVGAHKPDMADRILGPNSSRITRMSPVSTLVIRM